jgi:hypothetical protein
LSPCRLWPARGPACPSKDAAFWRASAKAIARLLAGNSLFQAALSAFATSFQKIAGDMDA